MTLALTHRATEGSARTEGWAQKRPPLGGGAGAARRAGAPGGKNPDPFATTSAVRQDPPAPCEYLRQDERAGR